MPEKAKNNGAVMPAAEIGDYSAFAPGNPDRPAFDPIVPPEDWRLAVRNLFWREDLCVRLRLMDRITAKTADGPDLFSRGCDVLHRPIPDMEAVIAEAAAALDAEQAAVAERTGRQADAVMFVKDPFLKVPSARAVLECGAINRLVTDYIGDDAIYQNVFLTRTPDRIDMHDYSGLWHHDKVGHRLTVFFLLEDVGQDDRPTMYAAGSHLLDWPDYYYQASRFREAFVLDHFSCGAMVAGRGDCTIFDTNGLHRAVYDAGRSVRSALVLEFASKSKFRAFQELGNFPIGVKMHHLSKGLNTDRTLVDTALITDTDRGMLYGGPWPAGIYPNFN